IAQRPMGYLKLLVRKTLWLVQAEESRDSHSYYFFAEQSPVLRLLPRWALLFPMACVGFIVIARLKPSRYEATDATPARQKPSRDGVTDAMPARLKPSRNESIDVDTQVAARRLQPSGVSLLVFYTVAAAATALLLVIGTRYRAPLVPALAIA